LGTLADGECAGPREPVAWIKTVSGAIRIGASKPRSDGELLALPLGTWVSAAGACEIVSVDTGTWLLADPRWAALDDYHALVLRTVGALDLEEAKVQADLVRARIAADRAVFNQALEKLENVAQLSSPPERVVSGKTDDPLWIACRRIAQKMRLELTLPDKKGDELSIDSISRASRFRYRKVVLKGEWWLNDSGPLLGRMKRAFARSRSFRSRRHHLFDIDERVPEGGHAGDRRNCKQACSLRDRVFTGRFRARSSARSPSQSSP